VSKLINLFGGPGIGKSGIAAGITYKMKKKHISVNNPYEFPKRLAWDNNIPAIKDQLYVFANQHRGIAESYGKVDYIVIDSPILFSTIYHTYYTEGYPAEFYGQPFHDLVVDLHRKYDSINILLERGETVHNDDERFQSYEQSIEIDKLCKKILDDNNISYHIVKVGKNTVKKIMKIIEDER
jgi:nicotinamide riboside kinase